MPQLIDLGRIRFSFLGEYSSGTTYEINDVVRYGANAYVYKFATPAAGNLPTNTTYWSLMTSGVQYEGVWSNATSYQPKDIVTFGAKAYIALSAHSGQDPTQTAYWEVLTDGVRSTGAWSSATAKYFPGDIVTRGGTQYITNSYHTPDASFSVDLAASRWAVFAAGLRNRGPWTASTAYLKDDIVSNSLNAYIATQDFTSNATNFASETAGRWTLFTSGTDNLPAQASNADKLLTTNGTDAAWTDSINLSGDAQIDGILHVGDQALEIIAAEGLTEVIGFGVGNAGGSSDNFTQFTVWNRNTDGLASTDIIAQVYNGSDVSGFIDMGITGDKFASETYGITGPNDGYIFMVAPDPLTKTISNKALTSNVATLTTTTAHGFVAGKQVTVSGVDATFNGTYTIVATPTATTFTFAKTAANVTSAASGGTATQPTGDGNLVLATGDTGRTNKIVFAAGGLTSGNTQMEITPDENIHIEIATPSTSPTTGALTVVGGVGVQGDQYILGDVSINGSLTVFGGAFESETLVSSTPLFTTGTGATNDTSDRGFLVEYKEPMASSYSFQIGSVSASSTTGTITRKSYSTVTKGITSNVATVLLDVAGSHDIVVGDVCIITNLGAGFDGTVTITAVTSTTISYVSATASFGTVADTDGLVRVKIPTGQTGFVYGDRINVSGCSVAAFNGNKDFVKSIVDDVITFDMTLTQASVSASGTVTVSTKTRYGGLARDFSTGKWVYFDDHLPVAGAGQELLAPSDQIDFAQANLGSPSIKVGGLEFTASSSVLGDPTFTGNPTLSGNVTLSGSANVISGTFTGNGTFSGNPTFSGTPVFSGNPSFTGTPVFSGGVRVQEMIEDVVDVSHASNVVTMDYTTGNIFFLTNTPSGAMTAAVTNAPTVDGRIFTINLFVTQGATGYAPTTLTINNTAFTIKWISGIVPTPTSTSGKIDIFSYTIMRRGGTYTAFGSATLNQ